MLPIIPPHPADIRLYNSSVFSPINAKKNCKITDSCQIHNL